MCPFAHRVVQPGPRRGANAAAGLGGAPELLQVRSESALVRRSVGEGELERRLLRPAVFSDGGARMNRTAALATRIALCAAALSFGCGSGNVAGSDDAGTD